MRSLMSGAIGIAVTIMLALHSANAADIRLLAAAPIKPVTDVVAPPFEQATKNKLAAKFLTAPAVQKSIEGGEVFDVAIATPPVIDALIKSGKIAPGSRTGVARFGLGIGVRSGAAKPNVGSADGLRQALLNAKSVGYIATGTSGQIFLGLIDKLGISDSVKSKLRSYSPGEALSAVASGAVELAFVPVPLIFATKGVELAGALPSEFQNYLVLIAGLATGAPQAAAGQAFIQHLMSDEADKVFKAKGFERVAN